MPTVWNPADRDALLLRIDKLTPQSKPVWGQFTVAKMLRHCADGIRMATGELAVKPKPGPTRLPVLKHLIIYVLPWPKGVPTAPELLPATDPDFDTARRDLKAQLESVAKRPAGEPLTDHPAFGALSRASWGALIHRHVHHHLTQFGV
jgi:hypothetical protein